ARANRLVLVTVKSFFGSQGVVADHVTGETTNDRGRKLYALLNNHTVREQVMAGAAERYGYNTKQVELRLYVGRFAAPTKGTHEKRIREWAAEQHAGRGPIKVFALNEVVGKVRAVAAHKQYRDNPVLVTLKVLEAADMLAADLPAAAA
ncbi:MAG TPA: hypothetical protein VF521_13490, partial [Pyrinomonadaceae bacterium]